MGSVIGLIYHLFTRELGPEIYDRHRMVMTREREPILAWLTNEIVYSWPMDVIDYFRFFRRWLKRRSFHSRQSHTSYQSSMHIPAFVDFYSINMGEFIQDNPNAFRNFNDFFIREIRPECRPVAAPYDDAVITSAADCRLTVFESLQAARRLFIKGSRFDFATLLGSGVCHSRPDLLHRFTAESRVANFRLHPMDYHRFHAPVSGKVALMAHIEGEYFTVKSKALHSNVNVLCENTRTIVLIESPMNGAVLLIPIGAEDVGSVVMTIEEGADIAKGDEIGMFQFGGSDVFVLFERAVDWDRDLAQWSSKGIETLVRVNERIGTFSR